MDDFLKSKAMITPGVAGATTTMITGTLYIQFGLPAKWVGLILSLLFALVIWGDKEVPIYQRAVFYIINTLTIFAVSIGLNQAGMTIETSNQQLKNPPLIERNVPQESKTFFHDWFQ
jgi:hypothetical protein